MRNRWKIFRKFKGIGFSSLLVLVLLGGYFGFPPTGRAQTPAPIARIHTLDTSKFPSMTIKLDLHDETGAFLRSLNTGDVTVVENGVELPVERLSVTNASAQIVVALNPALMMVNQYKGSSVFEKIQIALQDWLKKQPSGTGDDYNLAVNDGTLALHLSDPAEMARAIADYQPNLYTVPTNLNSLNTALEMSTDPNIPADIKKELLYIAPAPAPTILTGLPAVIERAQKSGVRVDVWLVSTTPEVTARGALGLKQLAEATGGEYIIYVGREDLPDPDSYLDAIRGQYEVTYRSGITRGRDQKVYLRIRQEEGFFETNSIGFAFDVQPPNPILLNPPLSIMMPVISVNGNTTTQSGFDQPIKAVIEFPDGHPRDLEYSQLYVDGQLVDENTAEPFDEFTWHVTEEDENIRHMLQVKVEDTLGLSRASAPSPVDVLENPESRTLLEKIASNERLLTASAIASALLAVLILLWLTSRRNRFKVTPIQPAASRQAASAGAVTRPVHPAEVQAMRQISAAHQAPTIPLKFPSSRPAVGSAAIRAGREVQIEPNASKRKVSFSKPARLIRLDKANKPVPGGEFLITRAEVTIGSSPTKSILVIDLPSVDAMHARLIRTMDDNYFLADCGSLGGTWVNFAPVSSHGVHLVDGDLIHFGRTPFRFELAKPTDPLLPGNPAGK
ncbi:MAG: FHA domain-containing protein [Anaerolineaceae bacterium]